MPPSITIGTMLAGFVQFIIFMLLLQPAINLVTPTSFQSQFYGLTNSTSNTLRQNVQNQLGLSANGTTGFGAVSLSNLNTFGGVAFVYTDFLTLYRIVTNFPGMLFQLFAGDLNYLPISGIASIAILSIGIMSYMSIIIILKFIGFIQKNIPEDS